MEKANQKTKMIKNIKKLLVVFLLFIIFTTLPKIVGAATLYFSPSSGSYAVGTPIALNVYVSSANRAMNAASGVITFPKDKLEVVSLSKTRSIFSLWVQEPTFSNTLGTVNFEGVVLNPGFTGARGRIITINFQVKEAGVSVLSFSSGLVLANDGQGTNILTDSGEATFSLVAPRISVPEIISPIETIKVPAAPQISSPTHPDSNKWYSSNNAKFNWSLPPDVTATRILLDEKSQAVPTLQFQPAISSRELSGLRDGVWYFHVRLRNHEGWGDISRFRFQIDTEKPSDFEISEIQRDDKTDPRVKFTFKANDKTSGIDYYEIQINNQSPQIWRDDGSGVFETPALSPGRHILIAKAIDKAGNSLASSVDFTIEALEPPTITYYPKELSSDEMLVVRGITYPNSQIVIWLQLENDEAKSRIIESDGAGLFVFVAEERLKDGVYKLWAEVIDQRGARSEATKKTTIIIEKPAILRIGSWAVSLLSIIVPLIALIFFFVYLLWYWWHKFITLRKKVKKEVYEAEQVLQKEFSLLKKAVYEQIEMLETIKIKRELTEEEEKIINEFKKELDKAKKHVKKEIDDIKKEVE